MSLYAATARLEDRDMRKAHLLAPVLLFLAFLTLSAQNPLTSDPVTDKDNPATSASFQIPSHGSMMNALIYIAPGAGPHPVVILLHGFPGNEKNLDLAQAIRR